MDTKVVINGDVVVFATFSEIETHILSSLRNWNNFESDRPLLITVEKTPSGTPTLGISVNDGIDTRDLFGGS